MQKTPTSSTAQQARIATSEATTRAALHRSVPPVHELTTYSIKYKPESAYTRFQRSSPHILPISQNAQERVLKNRKLLAKVVGIDATVFEQHSKQHAVYSYHSGFPVKTDVGEDYITRYNNSFSSNRSPRGLRSQKKDLELARSEMLIGQGLPATPRLLRGGNSKNYGIRRQISVNNQLELSPDFSSEQRAVSALKHYDMSTITDNTDKRQTEKLAEESQFDDEPNNHNSGQPSSHDIHETSSSALTNRLTVRDRPRDAPWVYCYKIKRDRLKLSQILLSKSITTSNVENLLPAF
ncbi:uncharacterized protein LOC143452048 [Clavelina lepadiformis]|uniref:uncharacterized protein LOC143452048 n=1 Tax=Clavelina lepadiformis TaxID=159417 RepID=UPI0040423423